MVHKAEAGQEALSQQAAAEAQDAWTVSTLFDRDQDKIILYVWTRDEAAELVKMLDCGAYIVRSGTTIEKGQIVAEWLASTDKP